MKDPKCYQHVLFEDLKDYLNRKEYLAGFTSIEQAYIRKNIGAVGVSDIAKEIAKLDTQIHEVSHQELMDLLYQKQLITGNIYIINDYQTIYSSHQVNGANQKITWGLNINPSKVYKLFCIAISQDQLMPQVYIIDKEKVKPWIVFYNPLYNILDDGIRDKGIIYYMQDENGNIANYDFKNILFDYNGNLYHTFSDASGNDTSSSVYGNKINGYNVIITIPINNLQCSYSDVVIKDNIEDMDIHSMKQVIKRDDEYYLDYLDLETLTHQFYGIVKNPRIDA